MVVEISSALLARIEREAAASPDAEVCGLLLGSADRIVAAQACRNVAANPTTRFEIDPAALIAVLRVARGGGLPVVGCYHSHPGGSASPSPADASSAEPNGWIWLIAGRQVCAWTAVQDGPIHGRFAPVVIVRTD